MGILVVRQTVLASWWLRANGEESVIEGQNSLLDDYSLIGPEDIGRRTTPMGRTSARWTPLGHELDNTTLPPFVRTGLSDL